MAKKTGGISIVYLMGMLAVVVGFCLPMFKGMGNPNGFKFINFDNVGFLTIGALLVFIGGVCGVLLNLVYVGHNKTLRLLALILSIVGGVVLFIGFNDNAIYRWIGKGFLKHAYYGFYIIVCGWILAIVGMNS